MKIELTPIGVAHTPAADIPRHWSVSDVEGELEVFEPYRQGLKDIRRGQKIVVLFHFDRSPSFNPRFLTQTPPNRRTPKGVFSICSPRRPNPIGLSVLEVLGVSGGRIRVKGMDMFDGTPIPDIKPHIEDVSDCPSGPQES